MDDTRVGFIWLYALIVLFAIGVIELVIFPAIENYYVPSLLGVGNSSLSQADYTAYTQQINSTLTIIHIVPYVILFSLTIYMVVAAFKKEPYEGVGGYR
jgi:hypothetical protein